MSSLTTFTEDPFSKIMTRPLGSDLSNMFNTNWPFGFTDPTTSMMTPYVGNMMQQFRQPMQHLQQQTQALSPILSADIVERDNEFVCYCDLPGVKAEDLSVEVTDKHLIIRGHNESVRESHTDIMHKKERIEGKVSRTIPLPDGANSHEATTCLKNGVLSVTFPKLRTTHHHKRKLEIKHSHEHSEAGESKQQKSGHEHKGNTKSPISK